MRDVVVPHPRRARWLAGALALGASCTTPATLQPAGDLRADTALGGEWLATVQAPNRGELVVRLTVARDGDRWEAYSRPGALRRIVGTRRYLAGRLLGRVPAHGSAVLLREIVVHEASGVPVVSGTLASPLLGSFRLEGAMRDGAVAAVLRREGGADSVGAVRMTRRVTDAPVRDYGRLASAIADTLQRTLFDPRLLQSPVWRAFLGDLAESFAEARDDLDALVAFYALKPGLAMSHLELTRDPVLAGTPLDTLFARMRAGTRPDSLVGLGFPAPGVALLRVARFDQVAPAVDRAFARIDSARPHTLVIDVRGNPGGDVSSVAALSHLIRDSLYVGAFLGRGWFATHGDAMPSPADASLPRFSRQDAITVLHAVRESGAILGIVPPRAPYFGGRVFLLADHGSGSATEPLAAAMQASRRGLVVGEVTAGAMLVAPPHSVGQGFVLVAPEADFRAANGARLEAHGVVPDVVTPSAGALGVVADSLAVKEPYAAAFLRGYAFTEARRWDDAMVTYDALLTGHPDDLRALYQVGRLAALSGRWLDAGQRALETYLARIASAPPGLASASVASWRLGMVLEARHDTAASLRSYRSAVALDSTNALAREALRRFGAAR